MSAVTYVFGYTGRISLNALYALARICVLINDTLNWTFIQPLRGKGLRWRSAVEHFVQFGVNSLPIVGLICFLIGGIMAMQSVYLLRAFGATQYVANLVGVIAVRELAPLMTAILLTGRSGSAITAEIGTMKVSEEIDALEVMGLNPTKHLVVPKFLAMILAIPCLTVLGALIMIFGGFAVTVWVVGLEPDVYINNTIKSIKIRDFATGLSKSFFFGIVICLVGVYRGFQVRGGAEGVGHMTTSSVVTSIFLIILVDLVFTYLFFF
ncbi:MAG TPA: ABC transporter permease [Candidatus Hydrogenedentes bacterium]|nr:ABC transporter permease [Candidatus Hydrogenedentota bacterium]HRK33406.1 ABC transporter permease [Candidatus Hydrogenedentota bacterium]